ncbi:MAG: hypothetical protein A2076_18770 [Geobacteraceae bacterium GWC2_53_11]|nr:MAG: hypothetical protein A2076_18770 [Geobacteraceae bacterium GWC2_53_11]
MKRCILMLMAVALIHCIAGNVLAAPQKVQITEFTVVGAENTQELKSVIKSLLSSRITTGDVLAVDDDSGVIARINGGYTSFGKTFSIDASVKSASGEMLGRRYVQGESPSDLIPAIGRLAEQLRVLLPVTPSTPQVGATVGVSPVLPVAANGIAVTQSPADRSAALQNSKISSEDIVRSAPVAKSLLQQTRIEGALHGIAPGRMLAGNEREYIVADTRSVYIYRQTESLKKVHEYSLKREGKILSIDTADVDGDGVLEVYVTVMDREELVSQALLLSDQGFTLIAADLPYFFRAVEINKRKKLYAQQTGRGSDDYYGNVCLVVKRGNSYTLGEPVKLPKNVNIHMFNRIADTADKMLTVFIDTDGNLHVTDEAGKELWKGNDRFGGSEVYFLKDEQQMQNVAADRYRWRFIEQRITVLPNGEIVIPRNSGNYIGNDRSFSKNSIFAFAWNGATLDERWHTKERSSYLADYFYDAVHKEMVTLEQVQKEGLFSKGASVILTNKME